MPVIHFGPSRLTIDSWEDLVGAAKQGLLDEHTYCELKKGLPPAGNNIETSKDLASLGVMGGVLIVGIKDAGGGRAGDVTGVDDPHEVKKRLVGVADGAVQPSLPCEVHVYERPDGNGAGCVVVEIPPSASAPHRADERYWGRGGEGKRVLADPEVAHLFAKRRNRDDDFLQRLVELEHEMDPVAGDVSTNGRLFFVADPAQAGPRMDDWQGRAIHHLVNEASLPRGYHAWPDLSGLTYPTQHPRGIAAQTFGAGEIPEHGPIDQDYAYGLQRMIVEDDGRVSYVVHLASFTEADGTLRSPTSALYERVDHLIRLTGVVATTVGAPGPWRVGVRLTRLKGAQPATERSHRHRYPTMYAEREYQRAVDVTRGDLTDRPEWVTEKLVAALARGFGEGNRFPYESPEQFFA